MSKANKPGRHKKSIKNQIDNIKDLTFWTLVDSRANKSTALASIAVHCTHAHAKVGSHTWHAVYFLFPIPLGPPFYLGYGCMYSRGHLTTAKLFEVELTYHRDH